MRDRKPFANVIGLICRRQKFDHSGMWSGWCHGNQLYAVWSLGIYLPVAAWRAGKWHLAPLTAQFDAALLAALQEEGGEVVHVTTRELSEFIHTGEPPTPPEVQALLSVSAD